MTMSNIIPSEEILIWYHSTVKKKFPWQINKTLYTVWVSEIMLQQTQVSTVILYYEKFLKKFPTISKLATANLDEVLYIWSGLGYYNRAINLYKTAKIVMQNYHGIFPQDFNTILSFPGIGKSTAGAILSLTLNQRYPILDSNIKRILIRFYLIDLHKTKKSIINKKLWLLIEQLVPDINISTFNQAIMDLGRLVCTYKNPLCNICPIKNHCKSFLTNNIDQYIPKKINKKKTKTVWWLLLWINQKKMIWLIKRSQEKIWTELFCFPEFYDISSLKIWLYKNNLHNNQYHCMNLSKHQISNINLCVYPILLNINSTIKFNKKNDGIWYDLNKPQNIGLPKPVSNILNDLNI